LLCPELEVGLVIVVVSISSGFSIFGTVVEFSITDAGGSSVACSANLSATISITARLTSSAKFAAFVSILTLTSKSGSGGTGVGVVGSILACIGELIQTLDWEAGSIAKRLRSSAW